MEMLLSQVSLSFNRADVTLDVLSGSEQHRAIVRDGIWKRHIGAFLATILSKRKSAVVFDVGAGVGYYSVAAAKFGARVIAFEPDPGIREILRTNIVRNGCTLVDVDGRIVATEGLHLRLIPREGLEDEAFTVDASVGEADPSVSIDMYCGESGLDPSLIKIAAEGRDLDVLAGAMQTLGRTQPAAVFELHAGMTDALSATRPADLFAALERLGYRPYLFRGHSVTAAEMIDFDILQRIYDAGLAGNSDGRWDVLLWPPRLSTLVKDFDRSRLDLT